MNPKHMGRISFKARIFADGEAVDKIDASSFSEFEEKLKQRGRKYT